METKIIDAIEFIARNTVVSDVGDRDNVTDAIIHVATAIESVASALCRVADAIDEASESVNDAGQSSAKAIGGAAEAIDGLLYGLKYSRAEGMSIAEAIEFGIQKSAQIIADAVVDGRD